MLEYSIVIPLYNEQDNILSLLAEIENVLPQNSFEVIFVNDGSQDATPHILKMIAQKKSFVKPISFTKNAGQTAALAAGFTACKGTWVITLDGDGQNDPKDILKLVEVAKSGFDLVTGKRVKRQDNLYKKYLSKIANFIRQKIVKDGITDSGCSLKVYRKSALDTIRLYKGMHRFLPALFSIDGYSVQEVEVSHRARLKGKSKYNIFNRGPTILFDLFAVWWMRRRKLNYEIESANHE
jgi:dolichol-phosphate mannosyltransferase